MGVELGYASGGPAEGAGGSSVAAIAAGTLQRYSGTKSAQEARSRRSYITAESPVSPQPVSGCQWLPKMNLSDRLEAIGTDCSRAMEK